MFVTYFLTNYNFYNYYNLVQSNGKEALDYAYYEMSK